MKTQLRQLATLGLVALALAACDASVNRSIDVPDGTQDAEGKSTVNGAIRVGDDVTVTSGSFRSVNGSARIGSRSTVPSVTLVNGPISVGDDSRTGPLRTVNGDVAVGEGTQVDEGIESVNGDVTLGAGAAVEGSVTTVNGRITLDGATVNGDLENVQGGMTLTGQAVVNGDLTVRRPKGMQVNDSVPVIAIGAEARVTGTLTFEREVKLQIHRGAQVGEIVGATPEYVDE